MPPGKQKRIAKKAEPRYLIVKRSATRTFTQEMKQSELCKHVQATLDFTEIQILAILRL